MCFLIRYRSSLFFYNIAVKLYSYIFLTFIIYFCLYHVLYVYLESVSCLLDLSFYNVPGFLMGWWMLFDPCLNTQHTLTQYRPVPLVLCYTSQIPLYYCLCLTCCLFLTLCCALFDLFTLILVVYLVTCIKQTDAYRINRYCMHSSKLFRAVKYLGLKKICRKLFG